MTKLLRTVLLGVVVAAGFHGVASAAEEKSAARPAAAGVKAGDTVYACGCGAGCSCGAIKSEPGKCGCGKDLVPVKVTKVENGMITVDRGGKPGETTFKATYKCGCGPGCTCNTAALAPGKCHCGKDLVKVE
jgi:hypothetical protein